MATKSILTAILPAIVPPSLSSFSSAEVKEYRNRIEFRVEEEDASISKCLRGKNDAVLDGFCNPIELQSFPSKESSVFS